MKRRANHRLHRNSTSTRSALFLISSCVWFASSRFLADMEATRTLVCLTQSETLKQHQLENEATALRAQLKAIEERLAQQKSVTATMLPTIVASYKQLHRSRETSAQLVQRCLIVGRSVNGAAYK